jgi:DNA uptake protein ComE-like DNA-binding protein
MRTFVFCGLAVLCLTGCTPEKQSPDAIREQTARATSTAVRDAKAVTQGVVQGLRQKGPVNINKDSAEDLMTLPGIDDDAANRIIEGRPYDDGSDLAKRHIISRAEYNKIASKIKAK